MPSVHNLVFTHDQVLIHMFLPPLLVDEHYLGYVGRVMRFNSLNRQQVFRSRLIDSEAVKLAVAKPVDSQLQAIAAVHGKTVLEVLSAHTFWSLRACVGKKDFLDDEINGGQHEMVLVQQISMASSKLKLCPDCIVEDLDKHGLEFWRCSHQLPGRMICPVHGCPLQIHNDAQLIQNQPEIVAVQASALNCFELRRGTCSVLIDQVPAVLDVLRSQPKPMDRQRCFSSLDFVMQREWPALTNVERLDKLKQRLEGICAEPWLRFLMPSRRDFSKKEADFLWKLDVGYFKYMHIELAVVILVALLGSAKEVLRLLETPMQMRTAA